MITYDDLKDYDFVFCDIFDTFIMRNVSPEYVKKVWCNHIVKLYSMPINMQELYCFRNNKEMELCCRSEQQGYDKEFKYIDLIKEIYEEYKTFLKNVDLQQFVDVCVETELNIEKSVQFIDDDIISVLKKCKKSGKKIYCISDMYFFFISYYHK